MEWLPAAAATGGPWAILGAVVITVLGAIVRGVLVPGTHVDRLVTAWEKIAEAERDKAIMWQTAHGLKVEEAKLLMEQNGKLLEHSAVSAHALESIRLMAEERRSNAA